MTRARGGANPPAEIEREIATTRAQLGSTLDALARRLTPNRLVREGTDMIARYGGENSGAAIRGNWVPLALIAAGIGWLIARNTGGISSAAREEGADLPGDPPTAGRSEAGGNIGPAGSLRQSLERHPLLVGLAGLVGGAAISAMLPSSKREREWSDKVRDELWNQAEGIGHSAAGRLRRLAEPPALSADSPAG